MDEGYLNLFSKIVTMIEGQKYPILKQVLIAFPILHSDTFATTRENI